MACGNGLGRQSNEKQPKEQRDKRAALPAVGMKVGQQAPKRLSLVLGM